MSGRKNVNKALYVALAVNWEGKKEVLGLCLQIPKAQNSGHALCVSKVYNNFLNASTRWTLSV